MRKIFLMFLLLAVFSGLSLAASQTTDIPEESIEGGNDFEINSDQIGEIEGVELTLEHDDEQTIEDTEVELKDEEFDIIEELIDSEEEATVTAEPQDSSLTVFDGEIDLNAENDENFLLTQVEISGERKFRDVSPAFETGTGEVETLDPELKTAVNHPEFNQDINYTFYDVESEEEVEASYAFSTCGSSGRLGPSDSDCDGFYDDSGEDLEADDVNVVGDGIQEFEVPFDGRYNITAYGAAGGGEYGGQGAVIQAEMDLQEGDILRIVVGQGGDLFEETFTAGSGGSFVTRVVSDGEEMFDGEEIEPILVAGGGAGSTEPDENQDANLEQCGSNATIGDDGSEAGSGGCDGEGGSWDLSGFHKVGGGGGLIQDGQHEGNLVGRAFVNSPVGGTDEDTDSFHGGFGGGGASEDRSFDRAGGGGGYSGGGSARGSSSGDQWAAGGGGGSYISSDSRYNAQIFNDEVSNDEGQGEVTLERTATPDEIIGSEEETEGDEASLEWSDRENEEEYSWLVEACDEDDNCVQSSIFEFEVDISEPEVDFDVEDVEGEHALNATAEVEYGRDDFDSDVTYDIGNEDGDEVELDFESNGQNMTKTEDPDDERLVNYTLIIEPEECNDQGCSGRGDFNDFNVGDELDIEINVTDESIGSTVKLEENEEIPNVPPLSEPVSPSDGGLVIGDEALLNVRIDDLENDTYEGEIYDAEEDETLKKFDDVEEGDPQNFEYNWEDLPIGEHRWGVEVNDTFDVETSEWEFTTAISRTYRVQKELEHRYSGLILDNSSTRNVFVELTVERPGDRDLESNLETTDGVEADFSETEESTYSFELSENRKRIQINVTGVEPGQNQVEMVTTDQDLGVNSTEEFEVFVRDSGIESRGVPGLQASNILIIFLMATLLLALSRS